MEISSVDAIPLRRELDASFANAQKWIDAREYCLVRLETTDGITGWGECWGPVAGNRELVESRIGPWLVGRDLANRQAVIDELRFRLQSAYHSYVPVSALSGVEIAMWDAYGRSVGATVGELLGGRRRETVPAYATGHFFSDVDEFETLRDNIVEEATGHVSAGFTALKQKIGLERHFGWDHTADLALVTAVRAAVGDDVDLMVDANHAYDLPTAKAVAAGLDDLDVTFFEEPVPPQVRYYKQLAADVSVPIATGECFAFEQSFDALLDAGALDYAQPDVTSVGGIEMTHRIARQARAANVPCYPHVFGSAVALAASLQVLSAIPGEPRLEFDRTPNPLREELAEPTIENEGAMVPVPDGPGLGIDIEPETIERFRLDA